jgi:hypothetical protein
VALGVFVAVVAVAAFAVLWYRRRREVPPRQGRRVDP